MDAFSLALSIGTLNFPSKINVGLSSLVGAFHFIMPSIGTLLGAVFFSKIHLDMHILAGAIFFYIAILMFKDFKKDEDETFKLSLIGALVFALGVSMDSFGIGFALQLKGIECIKSFLTFTLFSAGFTFAGLKLGGILNSIIGEYSVLIGAVIMSILGVLNFCQFLL